MSEVGAHNPGAARSRAIVTLVVQIAILAVLVYWTFVLVKPFLTIIIWSIILGVLLHPAFEWAVNRLRFNRLVAASLVTVLCLAVLLGPAAWLGMSLIDTARSAAGRLGAGDIHIPPPVEAIRQWPFIGDRVYAFWWLASTNLDAALAQVLPQLKPFRSSLLAFAASAGVDMLKFIAAVIIAGCLLVPGRGLVKSARMIFRRVTAERGDDFVDLIGATIRNLARGVIGVSILQALLAGIGLMLAGVPAAGFFSLLILLLGIIQIDAMLVVLPILIWSWLKFDTTTALVFSVYMVPVGLLNNFLRPFVMAHGLKTPMLVIFIGVIGGVLAHGVIGLFVGPIVLAIGWDLLMAWAQESAAEAKAAPVGTAGDP